MAKIDPKLLKKISQSALIAAATIMKIKNADKISKELLVPAFIKAVEAVPETEQEKLDDAVVSTYNEIVKTLGLDAGEPDTGDASPATTKKGGAKKEAKKAAASKKNGYSRIQAFCDAVKSKKSGKLEALISLADQKYAAKGGNSNPKEASTVTNMGIRFLVGMGIASLEEDNFKLI